MEYFGYNIVGDGSFGMKIIKTIGRGSLPIELRGTFTSGPTAMKAIDILRSKKETTNAEISNTN